MNLLASQTPPCHARRVHADHIDDNDGTAEAVAQRCRELDVLKSALNRWAIDNRSKIPKRARRALAQCRTLLSATVVALHHSLRRYDADVAAALDKPDAA